VRAPEGDPLGGIAALLGGPDRGAAPAARPPGPPVHPGLLARPPHLGGDLAEPLLVRVHQPLGGGDGAIEAGDLADPDASTPRRNSTSIL
jgi:hypothetical protein